MAKERKELPDFLKKGSICRRVLSLWGTLLVGGILSLIVSVSTMGLYEKSVALKWVVGILSLMVMLAMLFNHSYDVGHEDLKFTRRKQKINPRNGCWLAFWGVLPFLLSLIAVILAKVGVIPNILWFYQVFQPYLLPIVQVFAPGSVMENFGFLGFLSCTLMTLTLPAAIFVGHLLGFKDVDLRYEIMYKRKGQDPKANRKGAK